MIANARSIARSNPKKNIFRIASFLAIYVHFNIRQGIFK